MDEAMDHDGNSSALSEVDLNTSFHSLIDEDETKYKAAKDLNQIFGSDVKNLYKAVDLVKNLAKAKEKLEQQLMFAKSEAPDKVSAAVQTAEKTLNKQKKLNITCNKLNSEMNKHKDKIKPFIKTISSNVNHVQEVERVQAYQRWSYKVCEISSAMENCINSGDEIQLLLMYRELRDMVEFINTSQCYHLKNYTEKSLIHWHKVLCDQFKDYFNSLLKAINWPFIANPSTKDFASLEENLKRLGTITKHLIHLTLPDCVENKSDSNPNRLSVPGIVAHFPTILPPLQLLFKPFEVRFCFHFTGNKATNSKENPEWYFTQILQWISLHDAFLDTWIQPELENAGCTDVSAKHEFMRTLVRLVILKLAADLPQVEYDDDLFCHTIQETLNFERELRLGYGYPSSQPSVLSVLTQAQNFERWIQIERKFALELMDEIVSGDDAWHAIESGEAARCGEQLILLLQGITDRYKPLPQPGHRLQFLELQLDLVDDFRVRVLQLMKSEMSDPLTSNYGAILNTVHHITSTLRDWDNIPFFVEMQYYREQFDMLQNCHTATVTGDVNCSLMNYSLQSHVSSYKMSGNNDQDATLENSVLATSALSPENYVREEVFESLNSNTEVPSALQLTEVTGSVFEDSVKLYIHIQKEMTNTMSSHVVTEVRARSQGYRKDKWFVTAQDDHGRSKITITEVSRSFCPMLEVLARNLLSLRESLANPLFTDLWKNISISLNKFIYEEVILQNHFSEYGANQLHYDMYQGLYPIFGEFTSKPENYFKLVKESITLLTVHRATALLLKDTLKLAREANSSISLSMSPVKALAEHGVTLLTPEEADVILNIRTNMST